MIRIRWPCWRRIIIQVTPRIACPQLGQRRRPGPSVAGWWNSACIALPLGLLVLGQQFPDVFGFPGGGVFTDFHAGWVLAGFHPGPP